MAHDWYNNGFGDVDEHSNLAMWLTELGEEFPMAVELLKVLRMPLEEQVDRGWFRLSRAF